MINKPISRIGLYGGAFDPPHTGHHALAACAIRQLQLECLYVVPTGNAWHKSRELTSGHHRLAMSKLNFEDLAEVVIDDRELQRQGPSYTIDTLSELQAEHAGAELFLIMGADQAVRFDTWKNWQQIAKMAELVVAPRETVGHSESPGHEWHNQAIRLTLLNMPLESVSATDIRIGLNKGFALSLALKPSVFEYIHQHKLYMDRHD